MMVNVSVFGPVSQQKSSKLIFANFRELTVVYCTISCSNTITISIPLSIMTASAEVYTPYW